MIKYLYFLSFIFFYGCSRQSSFDELNDYKGYKDSLKVHYSRKMDYQLLLPRYYKLIDHEYSDSINFELFADSTSLKYSSPNMFSILKFESKYKSQKKVWDSLSQKRVLLTGFEVFSEGITNKFSLPVYYEHSKCEIQGSIIEGVSILISDLHTFYLINAHINKETGRAEDLKKLIYSIKTFE